MESSADESKADARGLAAYDSFISYSHTADAEFATRLRTALEAFEGPLLRARSRKIWQDDANLHMSEEAWRDIQRALDNSRHLVVLLSPLAARSKWVCLEVAYWLKLRPTRPFGLVLTAGWTPWTDPPGSDEATLAVPRPLLEHFERTQGVPLIIDMRRFTTAVPRELKDAYNGEVASVLAAITGIPKDELYGAHIRGLRRRLMAAVVLIGAVTVAAIAAAYYYRENVLASNLAEQGRVAKSLAQRQIGQRQDAVALAAAVLAADDADQATKTLATDDLVEIESRGVAQVVTGFAAVIADLAYSADGKTLLVGTANGELRAIDPSTGETTFSGRDGDTPIVRVQQAAPEGFYVSRADGRVAWIAADGAEKKEVAPAGEPIRTASVSTDGALVARVHASAQAVDIAGPGRSCTWAPTSDAAAAPRVWTIAVAPARQRVVAGLSNGDLTVLDATTCTPAFVVDGANNAIRALAVSPDGKQVALGTADPLIRVFSIEDGRFIGSRAFPATTPQTIVWSPDGRQVIAGLLNGATGIWDVQTGTHVRAEPVHESAVYAVAVSPDGRGLATGSGDGTVHLDTLERARPSWIYRNAKGEAYSVAFGAADDEILIGGENARPVLWSLRGQTRPLDEPTSTSDVIFSLTSAVAFSSTSGVFATAGRRGLTDYGVRLWSAKDLVAKERIDGHRAWINAMRVSKDGSRLATASNDDTVILWDLPMHKQLKVMRAHADWVFDVAFTRQGAVVTASRDRTLRVWDPETGRLTTLDGFTSNLHALAASPTADLLALGRDDGTIHLVDLAKMAPAGELRGHRGTVRALAFSPDGTLLASGSSDSDIRLWRMPAGELVGLLGDSSTTTIQSVAFSPSGSRLAAAGADGAVRVWEVGTIERSEVLSLASRMTNFRLCGPTFESVPVVPFPAPDGGWTSQASCVPSSFKWRVTNSQTEDDGPTSEEIAKP